VNKIFYKDIKLLNIGNNNILNLLKKKNKKSFVFLNPYSVINLTFDKNFQDSVKKSYNFIDGVGLQVALMIKHFKYFIRVTGFQFFDILAINLPKKSYFFLGSNTKTLIKIKKNLKKNYNIKNVNYYSPPFKNFFNEKINTKIVKKINKYQPDFLFVGMTAPKQEIWVNQNIDKINCNMIASIGLVFDYLSNNLIPPPNVVRYIGLEWLWRLVQQPKTLIRTLFGFPIFIIQNFYKKNFLKKNYYLLENNYNNLLKKKKFIYAAFNLSFYSFFYKENIFKKIILWPDGFWLNIILRNQNKLAGWYILENLKIPKSIKKIRVVGNLSKNQYLFLKKYQLPIINEALPFLSDNECMTRKIKIYSNELVLITLPSPKQEYLALSISKYSKNHKIICIGGGLSIASGDEVKAPIFMVNYGLEWLWRLRFETLRRIKRLSRSIYLLIKSFFCKTNNINIKSIYSE
jgi:N-acetylglucosaminyldiphosphoundecaprenol N-acetyl-beta-D-mannosaminyltransferase